MSATGATTRGPMRRGAPPDREEGSSGGRTAQVQRRTRLIRGSGEMVAEFSAHRCCGGRDTYWPKAAHDPFETFIPAPAAARVSQEAVIRVRLLVMLADQLTSVRRAASLPLSDRPYR